MKKYPIVYLRSIHNLIKGKRVETRGDEMSRAESSGDEKRREEPSRVEAFLSKKYSYC